MNGNLQHEKELLSRMIRGDESAYAVIYHHYHPGIYHYILRFVKLPDLAEDMVHDVFLKIWEIRQRINPELSFAGYLYRISRNHVYKTIRQISTDRVLRLRLLLQFQEPANLQEEGWQTREYERLLALALSKLPRQRRKVFHLCREEGKTYEETAAILHISRSTVKKHMVLSMRDIYDYILRNGDVSIVLFLLSRFV